MTLLSKAKRISDYQQKTYGTSRKFTEFTEILKDILQANVYLLNQEYDILALSLVENSTHTVFNEYVTKEQKLPQQFLQLIIENKDHFSDRFEHQYVDVSPLIGGGNRLGSLVFIRESHGFQDEDYIIAEFSTTLIAMDIIRNKDNEIDQLSRDNTMVQVAINSLSYSEFEAVEQIFEELQGNEGLLVASKVADRVGITRSVIVNALRKLESASIIESRSLGMKGTYIRILNDQFLSNMEQQKR